MDYYELLDIDKNASQEEIKKAYRVLAKKWHPDLNQADPSATEMFRKITEAYSVLSNPQLRQDYDSALYSDNRAGQESDSNSKEEFEKLFQYAVSMLMQGQNKTQVISELINYGITKENASYIVHTAQSYIKEVSATLEMESDELYNHDSANKAFIDKLPNWLRWILVLPGALATFILANVAISIFYMLFGDRYLPETMKHFFIQFINGIVASYYYVFVGTYIAPKFKPTVAIVLTVIFSLLIGILLALTLVSGNSYDPTWWVIVTSAACLIAAIASCNEINSKNKN